MRSLFLLFFLVATFSVSAQNCTIQIEMRIMDEETKKPLPGVRVHILQDDVEIKVVEGDDKGVIPVIEVPINHLYWASIEKDGYVTKCFSLDAHYEFPDDLPVIYKQPMETTLFKEVDYASFKFLMEEPMIEFKFDKIGNVSWDMKKLRQKQKDVADVWRYKMPLKKIKKIRAIDEKALAAYKEKNYKKALKLYKKSKKKCDCNMVDDKIKELLGLTG